MKQISMSGRYAEALIGIDLDNTLVSYDRLFLELAVRGGLVTAGFRGSKRDVRDRVRLLPNGELAWQHLQAQAYGPAIGGATAAEGAREFIDAARRGGARLVIVSHKTAFSNLGTEPTNLHDAARGWLRDSGIVGPGAILDRDVYFEPTRDQKIGRIIALGCTHFIDDLEEVLSDVRFPATVEGMLLGTTSDAPIAAYRAYASFREIARAFEG